MLIFVVPQFYFNPFKVNYSDRYHSQTFGKFVYIYYTTKST